MYRNKLTVLLYPAVSTAKPSLNYIKRSCVLGHFHTVGIIYIVSIRIAIGELIQHVINIINSLRSTKT